MLDLLAGIGRLGVDIANTIGGNITADKNLKFQQETLDYQKAMQREAWGREDNAIQRRVADLKAAGMSPVLAAGSAASSSAPISVTTPQAEYHGVKADPMATAQGVLALMREKADITRTEAETARINLEKGIKAEGYLWNKAHGLAPDSSGENRIQTEGWSQIFGNGALSGPLSAIAKKASDAVGMIPFNLLKKAPVLQKIVVPGFQQAQKVVPSFLQNASKVVPKILRR